MAKRKFIPTNDSNSPEEQSPTPPQNPRSSTPQGDRPGNPTPYSHGQGLVQTQQYPPPDDTSVADGDAAEVEEGGAARYSNAARGDEGAAATESNAAEVGEGQAASSDNSDAGVEQKKEDSDGSEMDRRRNESSLDERSVLAFWEPVYGRGRQDKELDTAHGNAGGGGKGK